MGALKHFWNNHHVDLIVNYRIFMAIPLNLLLWGCKSWALKKSSIDKLDVFLHKSIRRILRIPMSQVKDERIKNERIRKIFYNIPDIKSLIAIRQCRFVGRVVRGPEDNPPKALLSAWCNHTRVRGGQLTTSKKSIVNSLRILLPDEMGEDRQGLMSNWINIARNKRQWNHKIEKLKRPGVDIPSPTPETNNTSNNPPPSPPPRQQRRQHGRNRATLSCQKLHSLHELFSIQCTHVADSSWLCLLWHTC